MEVHDVETNVNYPQHLRVLFNGKYHNVKNQPLNVNDSRVEWPPDGWGARIADLNSIPKEDLYLYPKTDDNQLEFKFKYEKNRSGKSNI